MLLRFCANVPAFSIFMGNMLQRRFSDLVVIIGKSELIEGERGTGRMGSTNGPGSLKELDTTGGPCDLNEESGTQSKSEGLTVKGDPGKQNWRRNTADTGDNKR